MNQSPTKRVLILGAMYSACVEVIALTGVLLWPVLRARCIDQALRDTAGPSFWWPSSWRKEYAEYKTVQDFSDAVNHDVKNFHVALRNVKESHLEAKVVPGLVKTLGSGDHNAKIMAVFAIDSLDLRSHADELLPGLIDALSHRDVGLRTNVASTVGKFGATAKPAVPALIRLLSDREGDGGARGNAIGSLCRIAPEDEAVRAALRKALTDPYESARWNAAIGLARIDPTARDPLPVLVEAMTAGGRRRTVAGDLVRAMDQDLFDETLRIIERGED